MVLGWLAQTVEDPPRGGPPWMKSIVVLLTFTLASHGLKAYKYVPWGPVGEVLPYLVRRAQENADALSGAAAQRDMMLAEVRRRAVGV